MIEQTRFLSTVFLCGEFTLRIFTLQYIFAGKCVIFVWRIYVKEYLLCSKFLRENVCGNFYLRELIFVDRWKNRKNRKN